MYSPYHQHAGYVHIKYAGQRITLRRTIIFVVIAKTDDTLENREVKLG